MTTSSRMGTVLATVMMMGLWTASASAQVFGTFSWQMQPYCNVVTLTITQFPGGYTVDGNDDQCGAGSLAAATGQVHINPDGTVGVNFAIITTPTGKAVHAAALLSPATGSGTWTDSVGNSGTFALGANTPALPVRPFPASGLGASIITTTEIAAGAVGGSDINTGEVQARVSGACAAGTAMVAVNANGTVTCTTSTTRRYSGYKAPAAAAVNTVFDGTQVKTYVLPEPLITANVIDTADVQVWLQIGSIHVPLPYTSTAGGQANTIWHKLELGQIRIYRTTHGCTADATCLIGLPSLTYRYAISTGGTVIP